MRIEPFHRQLFVMLAAFGAFYALFAWFALHAFPFSGDEYSTFFQAELFARGLLRAPAPPHPELFRVDHVIIDAWVRSKYPPGTSALLALGVRAGAPWIVTPVEGVVALAALAAAARRLLGPRDALVAVAILGAAPLFAFNAATFYSHTASTMFLAIAFAAVAFWSQQPRARWALLAGIAIGCALLTRPLDAVLFAAALLSLRSVRLLAIAAAGVVPFIALTLAYQAAQFGSPFTDGYHLYLPTALATYGPDEARPNVSLRWLVDGEQIWNHLDVLRAWLVDWTVPGTALLAALGWAGLRDEPRVAPVRRLSVVLVALFVGSLLVTMAGYDDGARPRYLSVTLLPVAFLAGPGWRVAVDVLRRYLGTAARRTIAVVVWVLPPLQLGAFLVVRTPQLWEREGLDKAVMKQGIHEGVVVVRATYPWRYARNGPFFDGPVLYLSPSAATSVDEVAAAFPGRPVYEAHEGATWSVVRMR